MRRENHSLSPLRKPIIRCARESREEREREFFSYLQTIAHPFKSSIKPAKTNKTCRHVHRFNSGNGVSDGDGKNYGLEGRLKWETLTS